MLPKKAAVTSSQMQSVLPILLVLVPDSGVTTLGMYVSLFTGTNLSGQVRPTALHSADRTRQAGFGAELN